MTTTRDAALLYIKQGIAVVPVPHMGKAPLDTGWPDIRVTLETLPRYFNGDAQNIGGILGAPSNGLTDIDLDCQEAIIAAAYLMAKTGAIFGRQSKRASHRLYKTTLAETQEVPSQFVLELILARSPA